MSIEMANPGMTANEKLSLLELPPGMGKAQPVYGSPHAYTGTVILQPGEAFDFHYHKNQTETIYIVEGEIEGWIDQEKQTLKSGDVMVAKPGVVHATFNVSNQSSKLVVILDPMIPGVEEDFELIEGYGWEMTPVEEQEPWRSIRSDS